MVSTVRPPPKKISDDGALARMSVLHILRLPLTAFISIPAANHRRSGFEIGGRPSAHAGTLSNLLNRYGYRFADLI
jgi:hypothetical protein